MATKLSFFHSLQKKLSRSLRVIVFTVAGTLLFSLIAVFAFYFLFATRFYPQVFVGGVNLTAKDTVQAKSAVAAAIERRSQETLSFRFSDGQQFRIDLSQTTNPKIDSALEQAWRFGHTEIYLPPQNHAVEFEFNQKLEDQLQAIAQAVNQEPINSQLKIEGDQINVTPSQEGMILDQEAVKKQISHYLNTGRLEDSALPIKKAYPKLSYETALEIKKKLDQIKLSPLKLTFADQTFSLDLATTLNLIDLENAQNSLVSTNIIDNPVTITDLQVGKNYYTDTKISLNQAETEKYLKTIAQRIDRPVQEPLFNFNPDSSGQTGRITEFRAPQDGRKLDIQKSSILLSQALASETQTTIELPVEIFAPKNSLTNDLGVKELIGRGVSNFAGSIPNRVYNVYHAASKINGLLIAPGEEFSFVNTVGDISAATGYKEAYVIKSGRTVLDDGGGVCQVSTTIFRAALNSGLPITKRSAHAYRVSYYEQGFAPGLDATIFHPTVDFKFKNDTGHHILIQAYGSGTTLYVDIYGTSDGRVATVSKPTISNTSPAPAPLYQDDPTLPKGTTKQVDWAATGATVTFKRTVTRNGETLIDESFRSVYRPWQAVYLVGTGG